MFLLDTNVVSELRMPMRSNESVLAWARATHASDMFLSAVTILELEIGTLLKNRTDPVFGKVLRTWLDREVLPHFDGRILPIDTVVAQRCAGFHIPNTRPERDALIAATALVHGMTVVTRNIRDFEVKGVKLFCPWDSA